MMNKLKSNNRGFSLVEIIVAVSIMATIVCMAGFGLSLINGKPAEECARKLSSVLASARTTTMGKYWNKITISKTDSAIIVNEDILVKVDGDSQTTSDKTSNVGNSSVKLEYSWTGNEDDYTEITDETQLNLRFNSGTGALNSPDDYDGDIDKLVLRVSKANTTKYITISSLTGRITVS